MLAPTSGARFFGGLDFLVFLGVLDVLAFLELLVFLEHLANRASPSHSVASEKGSATL